MLICMRAQPLERPTHTAGLPVSGWNRRRFLHDTRNLAMLAGIVTLGGACSQEVPPPPPGIAVLTAAQAQTLAKLIEVILPNAATFPAGAELNLLPQIDALLADLDGPLRARFLDALLFLEWSPQFSLHLRPFSQLDAAARAAWFRGFATSVLQTKRAVYTALKGIVLFVYADHPAVWPALGYDGPWVGRAVP